MNKRKFDSLKVLNGDTNKTLGEYLGQAPSTVARKIALSSFTMDDLYRLKVKWNLTNDEFEEVFLSPNDN